LQNGQPVFDESDRGAEFCTGEGQDRIRVNFNLKKMMAGVTLDF
jgi:hypothetical protein